MHTSDYVLQVTYSAARFLIGNKTVINLECLKAATAVGPLEPAQLQ